LVFGLLCLLSGLGWIRTIWINYALMVLVVLLMATIFNRTRRALAEVA
jgi:hypothetical protein